MKLKTTEVCCSFTLFIVTSIESCTEEETRWILFTMNALVVGGHRDGKSFLGFIDMRGVSYESDVIATGFGEHLGLPLLRKYWRMQDLTKLSNI